MQVIQNNAPLTRSRFWRVLFWFTLIHLVIAGFMAFAAFSEFGMIESVRASDVRKLRLLNAASLWLFFHTAFVESALAAGDIAALLVAWRWAHRVPCPRRMVVAYLYNTHAGSGGGAFSRRDQCRIDLLDPHFHFEH